MALKTDIQGRDGVPYYLPKSLAEVTITPGAPPTMTARSIEVAGGARAYTAYYTPSAFSDDRLCVSRSKTGLLSKVYFSGDDRSDDVLLNVVQLAGNALPSPRLVALPAKARNTPLKIVIDPYSPSEVRSANKIIAKNFGAGYSLNFPELPIVETPFICPENSVCFATQRTIPVQLLRQRELVTQMPLDVVDRASYGSIDVGRAMAAARVTKLDFENGVLTSLRVRKDSEAVAISEIPLKAIERLIAVPGNGIAIAAGTYEEKKEYLARRKALQDAGANPAAAVAGSVAPPTSLMDIDTCLKPS